jgi:hypothetical protein
MKQNNLPFSNYDDFFDLMSVPPLKKKIYDELTLRCKSKDEKNIKINIITPAGINNESLFYKLWKQGPNKNNRDYSNAIIDINGINGLKSSWIIIDDIEKVK